MIPLKDLRSMADLGLALSLVLMAAILCFRYVLLRLKRSELELNNKLCLGTLCPFRISAGESATTTEDLRLHPLWLYIDTSLLTTLRNLPVKEPGRKLVAQDFLQIKFKAVRDALRPIALQDDLRDLSGTELAGQIITALNKAIVAYEDEAAATRIPSLFLQRFQALHSPEVIRLQEHIEYLAVSDWLPDNFVKMAVILQEVQSVLRRTVLDCERTLGTINGQLNGYVYRGITIQSVPGMPHKSYSTSSSPGIGREATV